MDYEGYRTKGNRREYIGQHYREVSELPDLIEVQGISYERFLQKQRLIKGEPLLNEGLEEVFRSTFPLESAGGDLTIEYDSYSLDFSAIRFSEEECRRLAQTYAVPLRAKVGLVFHNTGEIRQKSIYMGDLPLMTDRGTFVINGVERVVVSQIHRSPGVIFNHAKGVYSARLIPYRGSWLEFEVDQKRELVYAKIDRKKKLLVTVLLRALGLTTREKVLKTFHRTRSERIHLKKDIGHLAGCFFAAPVMVAGEEGAVTCLYRAGDRIHPHDIDALRHAKVRAIEVLDFQAEGSLDSQVLLNCLERETSYGEVEGDDTMGQAEALAQVYAVLQPGEVMVPEVAEKELADLFFSPRRYDLGKVGRYKLNKKFGYTVEVESQTLVMQDIISTVDHLIRAFEGVESVDDVDHLGNRRVRSVGELLFNSLKVAFARMERIARERMSARENETLNPQDLISIKPVVTAIKEFFSGSQLSQFMEQVNPLAELTHKRRLNALGPGGLSRERAGFEVRDVHYSHYGRMCPIETPEGPNIGLIMSLANYARINDFGFLETPYRKVIDSRVTDEVEYLPAIDEEKYYIAQASAELNQEGFFVNPMVAVRRSGDYTIVPPNQVSYMDVSPRQLVSTAASLIPFLEHDDANRALMGCNMQRQAVPLLFPEAPIVGTGMEAKAVYDAGVVLKAKAAGIVEYVSATRIEIRREDGVLDSYTLAKFQRTNQDTCFHQRSLVSKGSRVVAGEVLADGPATDKGELALGRNLLVGFMTWNGYNFEDAVLVSEKIVREDYYTSVHIKEFIAEVRETKLGMEKLTADIPNVSQNNLRYLDSEGIVAVGSKVNSGDVLVGKVTPRSEADTTPEFRLLHSIFGEKARDVRDSSLKLPHGVEGTIIDIKRLKRSNGDDLSPGVNEVIKVLVATKRKLKAGDKMAGRHGNKGVVAKVLPEEDMPFLADGTPLDICLNPLGVPSRMNIGQILEVMLGHAGRKLGKAYEMPVFLSASEEEIGAELEKAGLPKTSKMLVYDGLSGELFKTPILVGEMYYLKLHHLVDDKMHARSTGPYSLVTQQPLGGKAQFGGQRLGEMEVWALEAYGAAHTLHELMTIKSDDMSGRSLIYESIVKGEPADVAGIPESFSVFVQELRGLALDVTIYDGEGRTLPLTERDEELLSRNQESF